MEHARWLWPVLAQTADACMTQLGYDDLAMCYEYAIYCAVEVECPKVLCGSPTIALQSRSELTG